MRTSSVISLFDTLLTRSCKKCSSLPRHVCRHASTLRTEETAPTRVGTAHIFCLASHYPTSRTALLSAQLLVWRIRNSWRRTVAEDKPLYGLILWLTLSWFFCSVLKTLICSDWQVHVLEYERSHLKLYLKIVLLLTLVTSTLAETRPVAEWIAFVSMCRYSPFALFFTVVYCL
jgi:hypothetical protein